MTFARIDGREAWTGLSAEQQAAIGAAAIEMVATWVGIDAHALEDETPGPLARAFEAADCRCSDALQEAVTAALPSLEDDGDTDRPLPSILGEVCERCGCSQFDACAEGCGWAKPGLCSACEDRTEWDQEKRW